ncbi:MAG: ECF transporter S component, partial [Oscillospiraceae bacterium]
FLVGAVSGFVSNFFFGQGPWTPWQMFAFGIIGFISSIIFSKNILPKTRLFICVFGVLSTFFIYGGIMNLFTVLSTLNQLSFDVFLKVYVAAVPFDLVHALASGVFLVFFAPPVIDILERTKKKYGLI